MFSRAILWAGASNGVPPAGGHLAWETPDTFVIMPVEFPMAQEAERRGISFIRGTAMEMIDLRRSRGAFHLISSHDAFY